MRPRCVVEHDESGHDVTEVPFTNADGMIQAFGFDRLPQAFRNGIHVGRIETREYAHHRVRQRRELF